MTSSKAGLGSPVQGEEGLLEKKVERKCGIGMKREAQKGQQRNKRVEVQSHQNSDLGQLGNVLHKNHHLNNWPHSDPKQTSERNESLCGLLGSGG